MTTVTTRPDARTAAVENSTWYFGHVFSFLADAAGQVSATEIRMYRGGEPPVHVWGPREIPHGFRYESESARVLCLMAPAGAEQEFRDVGSPAGAMTFGPIPDRAPDPEEMARVQSRYRYDIVGPPLS